MPHEDASVDPFGTAVIRDAVLAGWRASPARFREDANAEEDFARGAYRDRLLAELAQNANDAAAPGRGRLLVSLRDDVLVVANTGRTLDVAGVSALATLRASAKRDDTDSVGRFGVGFAAVLAVTDEPRVVSRDAGVEFSRARTEQLVSAEPSLAAELQQRAGHVPVLRLPFPTAGGVVPDGYDTAVVLPLRDAAARALVEQAIAELDDGLLLAMPRLHEVEVVAAVSRRLTIERDDRHTTITEDGRVRRWATYSSTGLVPDDLLADRPVEERRRRGWSVTWALPQDGTSHQVLHAPTPAAEPLTLPATLIATFPLESGRRQVVEGPLSRWLVERCADGYADLVCDQAMTMGAAALRLVPTSWPAGQLDAALHQSIREALRTRAWIPTVDGARLPPPDVVRLAPGPSRVVAVVGQVIAGVARPEWTGEAMTLLGSPTRELSDVLDDLAALQRPATWWGVLYDALAGAHLDPLLLEGLPVPLAGGRMARGARGVLVGGDDQLSVVTSAIPELRVVEPGARHPLLESLGAVSADAATVLQLPALHAAVAESRGRDHPEEFARGVLALVARAGAKHVDGLGALALPTQSGQLAAAADLALPGRVLAQAIAAEPDDLVASSLLHDVGEQALLAVGVAATFPVHVVHDVPLDAREWDDLMVDGGAWVDDVRDVLAAAGQADGDAAVVAEATIIERLDEVSDDGWPLVLPALGTRPLRDAVVTPARVLTQSRAAWPVLAPSAWWLSEAPLLGGQRPRDLALPTADPLVRALFDAVPADHTADIELLRALGVRERLDDLLAHAEGVADLLERSADPARPLTASQLVELYRRLGKVSRSAWPDPPERVRAVVTDEDATTAVVVSSEVTVCVSPLHVPLTAGAVITAPAGLGELLDCRDSNWLGDAEPEQPGTPYPLPAVTPEWAARPEQGAGWFGHDELVVNGIAVDAWVSANGSVHASTVEGLARALAWRAGRWGARHQLAALLERPDQRVSLALDEGFD